MRYSFLFISTLVLVYSLNASAVEIEPKQKKKIDELFSSYSEPATPGCAVGIYEANKTLYEAGFGRANIESDQTITTNTLFDVGSLAKQFTAASILLLEARDKLSLDDSIKTYFPEFPDYTQDITIRHLLAHTSGLRPYDGLLFMQGKNQQMTVTSEQVFELLKQQKSSEAPAGEVFNYNNSGYFLAAKIVEKVSGKSFQAFTQTEIFDPLSMGRTYWVGPENSSSRQTEAQGYINPPDRDPFPVNPSWYALGAGGLYTSISDFSHWIKNFSQHKIGDDNMTTAMTTAGILNSGETTPYGMGFYVEQYDGQPLWIHGGSWSGYESIFMYLPEVPLSVTMMCNQQPLNTEQLASQVLNILLDVQPGQEEPQKPVAEQPSLDQKPQSEPFSLPPEKLKTYSGTYYSSELDLSYELIVEDGALVTTHPSMGKVTLKAKSRQQFHGDKWVLKNVNFSISKGKASEFTAGDGFGLTGIRFIRQ